jgi:isocitrate dehydrogenase
LAREAADPVIAGLERAFGKKMATCDLAQMRDGAREAKASEFATEVIENV